MRLSNESTLLTGTLRGLTALWFRLSEACGRLGPIRVGPTRKMADPWQECMDYAVALARQAGEVRAGPRGRAVVAVGARPDQTRAQLRPCRWTRETE